MFFDSNSVYASFVDQTPILLERVRWKRAMQYDMKPLMIPDSVCAHACKLGNAVQTRHRLQPRTPLLVSRNCHNY